MPSDPGSMGKVRLLGERPADTDSVEERLRSSGVLSIPPEPEDRPSRPSSGRYHDQILGTLTAAAAILNARIVALLAVVAAFVLALIAVQEPSNLKLYINLAFDLCVVCPVIALYLAKG